LKIINHLVTARTAGYARGREVLGKSRCVRPAHRGADFGTAGLVDGALAVLGEERRRRRPVAL